MIPNLDPQPVAVGLFLLLNFKESGPGVNCNPKDRHFRKSGGLSRATVQAASSLCSLSYTS